MSKSRFLAELLPSGCCEGDLFHPLDPGAGALLAIFGVPCLVSCHLHPCLHLHVVLRVLVCPISPCVRTPVRAQIYNIIFN